MNETLFILALVGLLAAVGVLFFLLFRKQDSGGNQLQQVNELRETFNKSQIEMMKFLADQLEVMRRSSENTSQAVNREAKDFVQRTAALAENVRQMHDSVKDLKKFEEVFKAPKARGSWGEASLAHLLGQYYAKELYQLQYQFSSGERADAIFKLPDGRLVSIDAKFPADNFSKMVESQEEEERGLAERKQIHFTQRKNRGLRDYVRAGRGDLLRNSQSCHQKRQRGRYHLCFEKKGDYHLTQSFLSDYERD